MELRDEHIVLRPWREDDAEAVYEACQDPEIQRWLPMIPRPYTREHARAFVTGETGGGERRFAVCEAGAVRGSIGIKVDGRGTGRVGYWCAPEARGGGIATRALRQLSRYALGMLELERLELIADPDNPGLSARGREGRLPARGRDALAPQAPRRAPARLGPVLAAAGRAALTRAAPRPAWPDGVVASRAGTSRSPSCRCPPAGPRRAGRRGRGGRRRALPRRP